MLTSKEIIDTSVPLMPAARIVGAELDDGLVVVVVVGPRPYFQLWNGKEFDTQKAKAGAGTKTMHNSCT